FLHFNASKVRALELIILIIPIPVVLSVALSQDNTPININNIDLRVDEGETSNFLFHYNYVDQKQFEKVLQELKPNNIHFYENLPGMGFVSLTNEQISRLKTDYPEFFSKMIKSEIEQVIPKEDELLGSSAIDQNLYISPGEIIEAPKLWSQELIGTGVEIAIIDSGIDDTHSDFDNRIKYQESFVKESYGFSYSEGHSDEHGHGTHVAGIAAGSSSSYPGIAPNATLINLKTADMTGHSTAEAFLAAVDKAIDLKVDIISISLGFSTSSPWSSYDILSKAVDEAVQSGIVVVVAAGNEGDQSDYATINSPASGKEVITVGASNGSSDIANFSSHGPSADFKMDPDVVAPGVRIYAPLATGSVLEYAYNAISGVYIHDYISLSGTSMAAPVVSGAVALLKQAFPDARPEALRAALQESAKPINNSISSYYQGNGLINVNDAYELLQSKKETSGYDIISSEPRDSIELTERVAFPGDQATLTIPFVTGMAGDVYFQTTGQISSMIEFDTSTVSLIGPDYFEKTLDISVPFNIAPGTYSGNLEYTFNSVSHSIALELTINQPETKIYWDSYYTGKDDSPYYNYRILDNQLSKNLRFDINEFNEPLTWVNLSNQNILVLTDLEHALSSKELAIITRFHETNGSILLVSSAYPLFNPDPYIQIAEILDIPVNFSNRIDVVNFTDDGRFISPSFHSPISLSWDSGNAFLNNVDQLPMYFGTLISGNLSDPRLTNQVRSESNNYLAAFSFQPVNKGKVAFLGSELWLYPFYLKFNDGQIFTTNVFSWLKPINRITENYVLEPESLEVVIYPDDDTPTTADIYFSNGTSIIDHSITLDNDTGNYLLNINLAQSEQGEISIQLRKNGSSLNNFSIYVLNAEDLPEVSSIEIKYNLGTTSQPSWAEDYPSIKFADTGIMIDIVHTSSDTVQASVVISSQPEDTLELLTPPVESIDIKTLEFALADGSNPLTTKSLQWAFPSDLETGFYTGEIQVWSITNISVLVSYARFSFFKPDPEPSLSLESTINGKTLDYYQNVETTEDIDTWNSGETIEFNLIGLDSNSASFTVYVQLIHYYLWFADRTVLDTFELPYDPKAGANTGTFTVPSGNIKIPDSELEIETYNQIFVLLIILRDEQGNYDIEAIFCFFGTGIDFNPSLLLVGALFGLVVLITIVILVRNRSKKRAIYRYPGTPSYTPGSVTGVEMQPSMQLEWKFCPFCGTKIPKQARYCSLCGEEQPFI
ncbi:MAG: S8 family serine peptidase, partial [Candidatus Hodarchaeales archaeon]